MRIARRKGREIDRAAAPGSVRAATSGPFLPRPGFKIFIYAFCAPTAPFRRTRATPSNAPQAARRAVRTPTAGRQPPAGHFPCIGALPSDIQHDTHPSPASLHPPSSFLSRHRTQGVLPLGRRTSPPGSPGAGGTKFSCTLVAHMWHFAYLCRRNTTSLGKRAIALLPHSIPSHFPHPTEHGSRPGTADTPPRVPVRAHLRQQAGTGVPHRWQRSAGEGAKVRPQAVTREGGREGRL